jgi:predicted transglutaminase-like cysteine proteinase
MCDQIVKALLIMLLSSSILSAQHLSSARGIGIAAATATTRDGSAIDWNPATLVDVPDMEVEISSYISTQNSGFSLLSLSATKRILENHTLALAYTPGKELSFAVPAMLTILDSAGNEVTAKYDREISYRHVFSAGYAFRPVRTFSLGTAVRVFDSDIADVKYYIDSTNAISSLTEENGISVWSVDLGAEYTFDEYWKVGGIVKNLLYGNIGTLPGDLDIFRLHLQRMLRIGVALQARENLLVGLEGDTESDVRLGAEWMPVENIYARGGLYSSFSSPAGIEAVALGSGISIDRFSADISYLWFPSETNRKGYINLTTFSSTSFTDLDYSPFTSNQFVVSLKAFAGEARTALAVIEHVGMMSEIYPASSKVYAFTPVGSATIRNTTGKSITAKVSFYIPEVMNAPTETAPYVIGPEEVAEIPFHAIFNADIDSVKKLSVYEGTVSVKAEVAAEYNDKYQTRVLVRGRNDWNGDAELLHYFVRPGDRDVMEFSRTTLHDDKNRLDTIPSEMINFEKARAIFNALTQRVGYVNDPKLSRDFVQYPSETLALQSGDCDDITVCYASLLMSVGISTAFVDVLPQDTTGEAHIYLMFDTGIPADRAQIVSENTKRYLIRRTEKNKETAWIPVETTLLKSGFTEAWNVGAEQFYREAEIGLGVAKGWVKIIDVLGTL